MDGIFSRTRRFVLYDICIRTIFNLEEYILVNIAINVIFNLKINKTISWIFWNKLTMDNDGYEPKSSQSATLWLPSSCLGWKILKMSLVDFPCLFYRIKFVLTVVHWLSEKMICCFISRSFSSGIMKCYISGTICKIAIFCNSNCYICGNI